MAETLSSNFIKKYGHLEVAIDDTSGFPQLILSCRHPKKTSLRCEIPRTTHITRETDGSIADFVECRISSCDECPVSSTQQPNS